ncbi:Hypothetical protein CINCED_3A020456 [Cinara cedri]|nr:Hypothetical protein CINCED_3A020456 [Cinara cedri]
MSEAIKHLEQKEIILEKDNKTLSSANKLLMESIGRLVKLNDKQQEILENVVDNINLLKNELEDTKKENLILKASFGNSLENAQHPFINKHSLDTVETHNLLLQQKIVGLEKQISQNPILSKVVHNLQYDDEQVSKLKYTNNTLLLQNRLLKEQLTNFRNLHYQAVSEYQLNNMLNVNVGNQQKNNIIISHMDMNSLNQNELQPLKVNVIGSDVEDNSY